MEQYSNLVLLNGFMNVRFPADSGYPCVSGECNPGSQNGLVKALLALIVAFMSCMIPSAYGADSVKKEPAVGIAAPFAGLVTIDGVPLDEGPRIGLGQWTLVMIWVTNCHSCREQKPKISAFHDARKNLDARVFGIAMDGAKKLGKVRTFLTRNKVTFPTFVGDMMSVMKDYEKLTNEPFRGTPTYLLFNPEGVLKGNNPGPITIAALERFIDRHSGQ